jgi:hypothetical protein
MEATGSSDIYLSTYADHSTHLVPKSRVGGTLLSLCRLHGGSRTALLLPSILHGIKFQKTINHPLCHRLLLLTLNLPSHFPDIYLALLTISTNRTIDVTMEPSLPPNSLISCFVLPHFPSFVYPCLHQGYHYILLVLLLDLM